MLDLEMQNAERRCISSKNDADTSEIKLLKGYDLGDAAVRVAISTDDPRIHLANLSTEIGQILQGPFSAVPKPKF